ncbi:unnamed protein product, partial [Ectocarpus sp. 8 AP-2014]
DTHNSANDGSTFTLAHNEFSHLSWDEFKETHFGYKRSSDKPKPARQTRLPMEKVADGRRRLVELTGSEIPDEVDWVREGAVTPVQNQGMCGSCWAFSTIGAMEGAYYLATDDLVKFSEEQLVDCDKVDKGCFGGDMEQAFDWIKENGGVCPEDEYPYVGLWPPFKTCATTCMPIEGSQVKEWAQVKATDEALMTALATVGPIAIAIEADQMAFQFYSDGVYTAPCGDKLDHGVLAVGYGTWEDGTDYWKVKNSWGDSWGQGGYILLERADSEQDEGGQCGLLIEAIYPILGTPEEDADGAAEFAVEAAEMTEMSEAEREALWALVDPSDVAERPVGFQSSASAKDCGGGTSDVVFHDVTISPVAPRRGQPVSMMAKGTLTKPLAEGDYNLEVMLGSSTIYQHDGSLCGESSAELPLGLGYIELHGLPCPATPGPTEFSLEVTLPAIAPPGDYDISLAGTDDLDGGAPALCLDVKVEL